MDKRANNQRILDNHGNITQKGNIYDFKESKIENVNIYSSLEKNKKFTIDVFYSDEIIDKDTLYEDIKEFYCSCAENPEKVEINFKFVRFKIKSLESIDLAVVEVEPKDLIDKSIKTIFVNDLKDYIENNDIKKFNRHDFFHFLNEKEVYIFKKVQFETHYDEEKLFNAIEQYFAKLKFKLPFFNFNDEEFFSYLDKSDISYFIFPGMSNLPKKLNSILYFIVRYKSIDEKNYDLLGWQELYSRIKNKIK
ncbi:hypothetical protein CPU12_05725 [Malaciobacter molluscorum LMG 25693]|uniref:Uncharacterized protein n=1 Tax=Malaciobacter molluscorum LMG 25693 TaxID=870501 RepID=A0A2G1DJ45_9BACT|nr:hypothetical protein [Malaciobacter molluscorum]AXX93235.1 hypothetical protein AMOL_2283 [Malaciobacter molluscorum LMG 25693]PHO18491.1 hypothetical protein CPU12_05725 [Malaciobacter molluscorum LMG 25693]